MVQIKMMQYGEMIKMTSGGASMMDPNSQGLSISGMTHDELVANAKREYERDLFPIDRLAQLRSLIYLGKVEAASYNGSSSTLDSALESATSNLRIKALAMGATHVCGFRHTPLVVPIQDHATNYVSCHVTCSAEAYGPGKKDTTKGGAA